MACRVFDNSFWSRNRVGLKLLAINAVLALIAISLGAFGGHDDPGRYYGERRRMTFFSVFLLLFLSYYAWCLYRMRGPGLGRWNWRHPGMLWKLMYIGFLVPAFDELFKLHEFIDSELFHKGLGIEETASTDRIDDAIILLYGLTGLGFMWRYRAEVFVIRPAWKYFIGGFLFFGATVVVDMIFNGPAMAERLLQDSMDVEKTMKWISVLEEQLKVLAEICFVSAMAASVNLVEPASDPAEG